MSASEEQIAAHNAQEEVRARKERKQRDELVAALVKAYGKARAAALPDPEAEGIDHEGADAAAHVAGLLAAAERAARVYAADLLRIECDLNGSRDKFNASFRAVSSMRRLRARMRGKPGA